MMDVDAFQSISGVLSDADDARRGGVTGGSRVDSTGLGDVHMLLFGDMKQLPPATGKAPFVVLPLVQTFDFRVLRQNRRVVQDEARREEIELFHTILTDISHCEPTKSVRDFIVGAYVRGASVGTAEHSPLEGNTAVFTKRRYRDAWNRCVTRRISKSHNHTVKIKAKVRARGQRGQNWYSDRRVSFLRSKCRTQNSWLLHLAGDHHASFETKPLLHRPHLMRCMLTSNLAVDQRFANGTADSFVCSNVYNVLSREGERERRNTKRAERAPLRAFRTQGRLLHWSPADPDVEQSKKAVPASHPNISARFVKETALHKRGTFFPPLNVSGAHVLRTQNKTKQARHVSPRYRYDRLRGSPGEHPRPWRPDHVAAPTRSRVCSHRPQDAGGSA